MSTPRDTPNALSDITNIADDARRTREERTSRQRVRRAEMSDEQREEVRRKQREYQRQYRERKKAESQNISATCSLTAPGTNHVMMEQNFALCLDKENIQPTAYGDHSHGGIGTATTTGSKLPGASGTHRFGMDQNSPIILNEDNIEPTTDGTATTTGSKLSGASGRYDVCVPNIQVLLAASGSSVRTRRAMPVL